MLGKERGQRANRVKEEGYERVTRVNARRKTRREGEFGKVVRKGKEGK